MSDCNLCNELRCTFNSNETCTADQLCIYDRQCLTYKRRHDVNYRELMQPNVGICHRENGKLKRESRGVLK